MNKKKAADIFLSENNPDVSYLSEPFEFSELTDDEKQELELRLTEDRRGNPGVTGYRHHGYASNKDKNVFFAPYRARGRGRDFGHYHQIFLSSQSFQDAWGKIEQGLITSHWFIQPAQCETAQGQIFASKQAQLVQNALFGIEGGWSKHITEALYMLVAGFAPFIRITNGNGDLVALSFRYPSQVNKWITDENESRWIAIDFSDGDHIGNEYVRFATELVVYQFRAIGNDFEGISPIRAIYKYVEMHDLFCQLEAVAAEKYGAPLTTVERPVGQADAKDDEELLAELDNLVAAENPIIILPGGYKVTISSPSGEMPNFENLKRYCDEKIATILSAEGSLIGLNGKGAYNLADVKDDQQLRSLSYYSKIICDTINSKPVEGQSLIEQIVLSLPTIDGVDYSAILPDGLPKLSWALSPEQDDNNLDKIIDLFKSNVLTKTSDDEVWLREMLKIPKRR